MKVDMKEVSKTKRVFSIEVPSEIVSKEFSSAYADLKKKVKIPGFRPGKAPLSLLERRYSSDVETDLLRRLIPDYYLKAVKESGVTPVDMPEIENVNLKKDGPLTFTASVEIKPEIENVDYEGIELKKEEPEVTEKDIDDRMENLRNMHARLEPAEEGHAIETGDYAQIDYAGFRDDKPVKGAEQKGVVFQVGASPTPEIDKGLTGARKGEEKEIVLTEQNMTLKIKIAEVKKKVLPEVNDDLAREIGGYDSLTALREGLKSSILEEKKSALQSRYREDIIKKLIERNPIEAPSSLVERDLNRFLERTRKYMGKEGEFEPEEEKSFREKYRPRAEEQIKGYLLLAAIGERNSISPSEADIEEEIRNISEKNRQDVKKVRKSLEAMDHGLEGLKERITEDKVIKLIMDKAKWN